MSKVCHYDMPDNNIHGYIARFVHVFATIAACIQGSGS